MAGQPWTPRPGHGPSRIRTHLLPVVLLSVSLSAAALEPPYESLNTATLLPERVMSGPDYRILPEVVNRGLMNHYLIDTDYGSMRARSDRNLQQRLREIRALRELDRMHEARLVAESVGRTFVGTARSVARVIKDPVGTADSVQQGIHRLMRRGGRKIRNAYDDVRNSVSGNDGDGTAEPGPDLSDKAIQAGRTFARNRLGVSRAYRELAREVGIDPYTDNGLLRAELNRLAGHSAGASLGSRLVIPRIPGLIGAVENVSDLVWSKDRLDLLLHNEDVLAGLPVPEPVARRFIENEAYSPTQQTAIVAALESLRHVANHWRLLEYAGHADSLSEADFYTDMIGLLALYHETRAPLDTIHPTATIVPVAVTDDHRSVAAFPVDRFRWTRDVDGIVAALTASPIGQSGHREIWITGVVSEQADTGLSGYGWIPYTRAHQRLRTR
ncbi:MAG: hypothetical protein U5R46_11500 [Gammaproteobacteria bacterium]|nr:hypothetical protein [Gammaproteobacteria bacterium]